MIPLQYFDCRYQANKDVMHQSVVLKARVENWDVTETAVFELTDQLGTFYIQEDVYFNVPQGNLKLRIMHPNRCGQLIFNCNSKNSGHKVSESQVTEVEDVYSIRTTLGSALGERGTIRKKRRIFTMNDVRIYLDDVDEIGHFIDIAITINGDREKGIERAGEIREKLGISHDALVPAAYLDLLMCAKSFEIDDDFSSTDGASSAVGHKESCSSSGAESDASA